MVEAELLFTELFNCDRLSLYLEKRPAITKDRLTLISSVLKRRIRSEPIQYILGKTEFMGLKFKVAPCVFIPRPETEVLVETTIDLVHSSEFIVQSILDLGTGSGCIAVSLANFLDDVNITATDISQDVLDIANENARINSVTDKIRFIKSNLFESLAICDMRYAICVCNPPYIPTAEIDNLQPEVQYEPRLALDGGKDGLEFYRKIISLSPCYLKKDGLLIMEMGFNQAGAIRNIFKISGKFKILEVVKDYNNIDRVVVARKVSRNG
jgi:release factor glutamine methyltransferase